MFKNTSALLLAFIISFPAMGAEVYFPKQENGKIVTHQVETKSKPEPLRSMVSQKNLLGLERDNSYGLPKAKRGQALTAFRQAADWQIDSLHVLVLKVEFELEDPDDSSTTGVGTFDLRTQEEFLAEEGHDFDPAPHNSEYFSMHMEALKRYWYYVSDRQIRIGWDIYPENSDDAYRLPHPMSYYGSDVPSDSLVAQLLNFTRDAITMADSMNPEINFADYQSILIFHAGADQQNNFYYIYDTPNDLYTGFLWTQDTIFVDDGTYPVTEAIIMPETVCQDNRITVLNAVMAHEFGHQLGLVDIYNTSTAITQVGNFSLMDNNCSNFALELDALGNLTMGALPCYPDAWSRSYLGFSGVTEVTSGDDVAIRAAEQTYYNNEVVKVPISEMEYFLVENRQTESDFEYLSYDESQGYAILADSATGVILGPGWAYYIGDDIYKVASGEYDRLLPGDGLLIWHVDELVAYLDYYGSGLDNFLMNTLQQDYKRRFLSLVEADGIIDFGGNYYTEYGEADDYFCDYNNTAFTPSTNPSTKSNLGADTHISITDIKSPYTTIYPNDITNKYSDTLMYCDIAIDWYQEGFPVMGLPDASTNGGGLLACDIDSDGDNELLMARGFLLLAVESDGLPVMDDTLVYVRISNFDDDTLEYHLPRFAVLSNYVTGDLVAGDFDGDNQLEAACFDLDNEFYIFEGNDISPCDSIADLLGSINLPSVLAAGPIVYQADSSARAELIAGFEDGILRKISYTSADTFAVVVLDSLEGTPLKIVSGDSTLYVIHETSQNDKLYIASIDGDSLSAMADITLPSGDFIDIACGDINRDDACDAVITIGNYLCIYDGAEGSLKSIAIDNPGEIALGDLNADGYPDIVLTAGGSYLDLYAFNHNGILFDHFPIAVSLKADSSYANEPLLADFDDDNLPDIIVALPNGSLDWGFDYDGDDVNDTTYSLTTGGLTCFNYQGERLAGFPLPTSTAITVEPVLSNFDSDSDWEIAAIDSAGFITMWELDTAPAAIDAPWTMAGGGISRSGYLSPDYQKEINIVQEFLPDNRVYNYPNPAANSTTFRYYVDRPASINIKIFDLSGELVDELDGSTLGEVDDEIVWDCSEFASGVYFARFEADASDANKNVLIKVALIK